MGDPTITVMPGGGMPSPAYLDAINASRLPPPAAPEPTASFAPPVPPPPGDGSMLGISGAALNQPIHIAGAIQPDNPGGAPPPPAQGLSGPSGLSTIVGPRGLAPDLASPASPVVAPPPAPQPYLTKVRNAGSYLQPAKETEMRGPQLLAAQGARNVAMEGAVQAVQERSERTAAGDYAVALDQQRLAGIREDAANVTAAQRTEELQQRQADFDQSVKALSQVSVDPGRFWAMDTTGGKIKSILLLVAAGLGGYNASRTGGRNLGMDQINTEIDRDIKAQEHAFTVAQGATNAKQTAFSMAMQKYNNVDQARAAARAAALDSAQAQLAGQAALWRGTDAANRATMANAALQDEKMVQTGLGVNYAPPKQVAVAAQYATPSGIPRTADQAAKWEDDRRKEEHDLTMVGAKTAGTILEKQVEGEHAGKKEADAGAKFLATELRVAGVPQARASAERALASLNKDPGGKIEAIDRAIVPAALANAVHPESANQREQDYSAFKNASMKLIFGNVTSSEEERADKQFGFSGDPESRRRAIAAVQGQTDAIEKGIKAGVPLEVQQQYNLRRLNAEGGPPLAPAGAKPR